MAFRHFGGKAPEAQAEWTCPSCATVQSGPLKAGCQKCGAGNDAKRVVGALPQSEAAARVPLPYVPTGAAPAVGTDADEAWMRWSNEVLGIAHVADVGQLKEAFMAGVAWAQGEAAAARIEGRTPPPVIAGHNVATMDGDGPAPTPQTLWLDDGKHQDPISEPTLATLLAALAFYRDNVLNYGLMAGQLSPEQVTDLITRLTPQESEA